MDNDSKLNKALKRASVEEIQEVNKMKKIKELKYKHMSLKDDVFMDYFMLEIYKSLVDNLSSDSKGDIITPVTVTLTLEERELQGIQSYISIIDEIHDLLEPPARGEGVDNENSTY
jgi:hypothetical protein